MLFSSIWFDLAGIDPGDCHRHNSVNVCREPEKPKSKAAVLRERFARNEFDKIRRLLERTKVFNNEMIVRNSCRVDSLDPSPSNSGSRSAPSSKPINNSLFQSLPDIVLLHIFQYARPKNYQAERQAAKEEGVGGYPRTYPKHPRKGDLRRTGTATITTITSAQWQRGAILGEWVERRELAEASGSSIYSRPMTISMPCRKRPIRRISGSGGCHYFNFQLHISSTNTSEISLVRQVSLDSILSPSTDNRNIIHTNIDIDTVTPRRRYSCAAESSTALRKAVEVIDALQRPDWRYSITLLNPDTHMTGPCFRDFQRYVESFHGWTTERLVATMEERDAFGIDKKKGKVYFLKILCVNRTP